MGLQELLEVAIGLIFMWFMLSVATMQTQEWIASYLGWRAKGMEKAIRNMLGDSAWTQQLYEHPVVQALGEKTGVKPSYIPADKFAVALFDVVMTAGTDSSEIQRTLYLAREKVRGIPNNLPDLLSYLVKGLMNYGGNFFAAVANFLVKAEIKTKDTRYAELTKLAQEAVASSQKMTIFLQEFLGDVNCSRDSDGNIIRDKIFGFTAAELVMQFPELKALLHKIYDKARKIDPTISNVSKEQFAEYSIKEIDEAIAKIKPIIDNSTAKIIEDMGFNFETQGQNALGRIQTGLGTLVETNPTLHRALESLTAGLDDINKNLNQGGENAIREITVKEKHLAAIRKDAETWFDDVMARTQGWYKRKAQVWALGIGLLLALLLNVDSIALANQLWREPLVRQSLVSTADQFIAENENTDKLTKEGLPPDQAIAKFQERFAGLKIPFGWSLKTHNEKVFLNDRETTCSIPAGPEQMVGFYVPFTDYDSVAPDRQNTCLEIGNPPKNLSDIIVKFVGILISALAAMQGAPFWFDILKKVVNVRGEGANPVEKPKALASRGEESD